MSIPNLAAILASNVQIGGNANETAVAKAYLQKHADDFDRVEFNVPLGPGITLPGAPPAWVQKMATYSSKPKADMICYRGTTATIVECKGRIYSAVMGQLLTYWHILREDNKQLSAVYKVAAGQTIQDGIGSILDQYGISVELFPYAVALPLQKA